eukprot:CAMPEP_0170548330 /NCGR_PEP_ID=MMETSP0211-20121228/6655_1 /TAXON_ID=311385 /ORGANISM="Pseudokeronopsis sp., Strain OXSARD2" /LENGTH=33 /DNA_ID= /DNA_START= /DNA_END= /DNA_ORIENTATION=
MTKVEPAKSSEELELEVIKKERKALAKRKRKQR